MLSDPVTVLKGVGEKASADLGEIGISTVEDLLFYFPYRYDVTEIKPLSELIHDDKVTIEGKVIYPPSVQFYGPKKSRLSFNVDVEGVAVKAVMFNRSFAKNQLNSGDTVTLTGKWDAHRLQITVSHYKKGPADQQNTIQPVYSLKGNLTNGVLKKAISSALTSDQQTITELLPVRYLEGYKLPDRPQAVATMHFPESRVDLKHARRRFTYEEFLLFQLKMQLLRKLKRESSSGNAQHFEQATLKQFISQFPFSFTDAQNKALKQILADMKSPYCMNRLLQGDVGSGKTAVAEVCLYASITAGKQGALLVPTEILAEQHFQSLQETFDDKASVALLTGSVKGKKRQEILTGIARQEIDIVVGTHALIQDDVTFYDLGFAIVDEQHRFGVRQRRALREKALNPDVLFMTATPIPRTLAITAFGDMDVSVIDEMPSGRKTIETYWAKENTLDRVLTFIGKRAEQGEQAYVVCPLIEESDKLDIQNAVDLYQQLATFYSGALTVGLLHGRLSPDEKDSIMKQFAAGNVDVLVSTTVVEVGVNVTAATTMVIYDAERFGLSQLHQLRGRVGRGDKQSYCILLADPKGETGRERMRIMTETNNGFELSERDLKLRGPGDFFGKKQSGLPAFKVADMIHDYRALETARKDAEEIIENGMLEHDPECRQLQQYLEQEAVFQEKLD
ncbi:ATP-dependent DNA helicase RecG [Barrientosiimonas marina]|uniref:ATP-dependent DNA helicase RecG n=1 Tax=Lentibacillus kimchii TaxID=1542911 RepID=A0ABW2UPC6_9BACI